MPPRIPRPRARLHVPSAIVWIIWPIVFVVVVLFWWLS